MNPIQTFLTVLVACVFAAMAKTQPPPFEQGGPDAIGGGVRYEQRADGMVEITTKADGSVSERRLSKEEVAELRRRDDVGAISANHLVRGEAYANPRRLAPGQSGTLKVIALLSGDAVVLAGSNVKVTLDKTPGLSFGQPVQRPAKAGTREGKFQGQLVHDDFVAFDVPLTVDATAKIPSMIYLKGKLNLDLHSGRTGAKIGSFVADVGGRVEIGQPLPTPNVAAGMSKTAKGHRGKTRTKPGGRKKPQKAMGAAAKGNATGGGKTGAGAMGTPDGREDAGSAEGDAAETDAAGGPDIALWGVGVGVVIVVFLLILARRK